MPTDPEALSSSLKEHLEKVAKAYQPTGWHWIKKRKFEKAITTLELAIDILIDEYTQRLEHYAQYAGIIPTLEHYINACAKAKGLSSAPFELPFPNMPDWEVPMFEALNFLEKIIKHIPEKDNTAFITFYESFGKVLNANAELRKIEHHGKQAVHKHCKKLYEQFCDLKSLPAISAQNESLIMALEKRFIAIFQNLDIFPKSTIDIESSADELEETQPKKRVRTRKKKKNKNAATPKTNKLTFVGKVYYFFKLVFWSIIHFFQRLPPFCWMFPKKSSSKEHATTPISEPSYKIGAAPPQGSTPFLKGYSQARKSDLDTVKTSGHTAETKPKKYIKT